MSLVEATLIGQKHVLVTPNRRPLPAYVVMELETEEGQRLVASPNDPRLAPPNPERRQRVPISLARPVMNRLVEFFDRAFVQQEPMDYDCNGFPPYLLGYEDDVVRMSEFKHSYTAGEAIDPRALERGTAYAVIGPNYETNHAMLGINQPILNLSTPGRTQEGGGLLIVSSNPHTLDTYNGQFIAPWLHETQILNDGEL